MAQEEKISDVQSSYDKVADEYARHIYDELQHKPLDCSLLDRFADSVRNAGIVCDLGCGPGHVARYLRGRGAQVCGIDLSQGMIEQARRLNPDIDFNRGDMRALPVNDNAWAGIAAFYSVVNLPASEVVQSAREMMRALMPGGRLLLSFHIGEDTSQMEEELWGREIALEINFFRVSTIASYISNAGLDVEEIIERGPYAPEVEYQSRRAYIFAQKPMTAMKSA